MAETDFPNLQQKLQSQLNGTNGRLKFPLDNQDDYKGRIIFAVYDEDATRTKLGKFVQEGAQAAKKALTATTADQIDDFFGFPGSSSQASSNPANLGTRLESRDGTGISSIFSTLVDRAQAAASGAANDEKFSSPTDILKINSEAGSVELYLPQAIQIQDAVTYGNIELGAIGGAVENALNTTQNAGIGTALEAAAGQVGQAAGGAYGMVSGGGASMSEGMAALAFQRIGKKIPAVGAETTAAIKQTTGITTNPNVRTQFQSVPIRQFSFTFTMIPKSQSEAAEVAKIIKWFRTELYPEALISGGVHYGYKFPNRFQITVKYGNLNDSQAANIRFLPVYLQSFSSNYNPNGMGMHSDGSFPEVQFTMSFTESRALNRQDVVERGF